MSNLVNEYAFNRTPEVEQLYNLYQQGVVDIYGNPFTETFGLDPNNTVAYPAVRLGISSDNPNFTVIPFTGASTPLNNQNTGLLTGDPDISSSSVLSQVQSQIPTCDPEISASSVLSQVQSQIPTTDPGITDARGNLILFNPMNPPVGPTDIMAAEDVEALYQKVLNRESDPGGLAEYTGKRYKDVYDTFLASDEYAINEQYKDLFGRPLTYDERAQFTGLTLDEAFAKLEADSRSLQTPNSTIAIPGSLTNPINTVVNDLAQQQFQTRQITPGSNFLPTNIPTGFFGANDNVAQLYNLGQTPTFRSGVGGYTDMLPSGFEFGIPAQFAQVPIYVRGLFDTGEDAEEVNNNPRRGTYAGGTVG